MEDYTLSDSEFFVMKVIWRSEESLSLQDIAERVNKIYGKNWKPQTVSMFLGKIVKKNLFVHGNCNRGRKCNDIYFVACIKNREITK